MPNTNSAKKRLKTAAKANVLNSNVRARLRTFRRKLFEAVEAGDQDLSKETYSAYCSVLDRAAKKGVIKKNTASRRKSRAAEKLRSISK